MDSSKLITEPGQGVEDPDTTQHKHRCDHTTLLEETCTPVTQQGRHTGTGQTKLNQSSNFHGGESGDTGCGGVVIVTCPVVPRTDITKAKEVTELKGQIQSSHQAKTT